MISAIRSARHSALTFAIGLLFAASTAAAPPPASPWEIRIADDGSAEILRKKSGLPLFRTLGVVLVDARGLPCARPDAAPPHRFGNSVCRATDTSRLRMRLFELPGDAVRCSWSMRFLNAIPCAVFIALDCELHAKSVEPLPPGPSGTFRRRLVSHDGDALLAVDPGAIPAFIPQGDGKVRMRMLWRYDPFFVNTVETAVTLAPKSVEKPLAQKSGEQGSVFRQ